MIDFIYNLTQHAVSADQYRFGIIEVPDKDYVCSLLTFNSLPSVTELARRAFVLANYADFIGAKQVMIGGAPFFMSYLEKELKEKDIKAYYAFSKRDSIDTILEDGSVIKKSIFQMEGLIEII